MEIYNEVGYDLLDSKHQAYCFEQLPKIVLLEDSKGEIHLRNLSVHNVSSVKEAMRLLFLGDTNRTIAETPSNDFSSRSHCIFTIYLSFWVGGTGKIRRSKLNLVDLAGSERIYKSNVTGVTLMEAKSINLSLYYLEQVILALSEAKRSHVPYRNSIMTNILKDSLGGNCFTLMLATVTISPYNFEETLSTCKFSQRVAMVSTDAYINEEFDPYQEISELSKEVENLRNHLKLQSCPYDDGNTALTDDEISKCKEIVSDLIDSDETSCPNIEPNMKIIQHCFNLLKGEICHLKANLRSQEEKNEAFCDYEGIIKGKDEEIERLNLLLRNAVTPENEEELDSCLDSEESPPNTCRTMDTVPRRSKEEIRIFKIQGDLHKKYDIAKSIVPLIEQCQRNIIMIRKRIDSNQLPDDTTQNLLKELQNQQDIYRESLMQLQSIKAQVEHLEHGLQQAEFVMGGKLKKWVCESSSQIIDRDIPQIEDTRSKRSTSLGSTCKSVTVSTNDVKEIGLQTVEDRSVGYSNHRPSTSCDYSRNSSSDLKCYNSEEPFCKDCKKFCERSKSARCIKNDGALPLDDNCYATADKPTGQKVIREVRERPHPILSCHTNTETSSKKSQVIPPESENVVNTRESFRRPRMIPPVVLNSFTDTREVSHPVSACCSNKRSLREPRYRSPPTSSENIKNTKRSFKESRVTIPADSESLTSERRSYKKSREIPPVVLDSFTNVRKSSKESRQLSSRGYSENRVNNKESFRQSREKISSDSESLLNVKEPFRRSRDIPAYSIDSSRNSRKSSKEPIEISPPILDSLTNVRKSSRESKQLSSRGYSENRVNNKETLRQSREKLSSDSESLLNVKEPLKSSREITPYTIDSSTNTRKSSKEPVEISPPILDSSTNRKSLDSSTNPRKSLSETREITSPISDSRSDARKSSVEPRRASSLSPDDLTQSRKSLREPIEITINSNSLDSIRKSLKEDQIYHHENGPNMVDSFCHENYSQENLNVNSNSVIDLRRSSKSFQINNDISDNEDTYDPCYSGQGIQSVDEKHYHVNSVPFLNVMSGITSHSQNTFMTNKVGSFLDDCHLLRPNVPYFDVHVKIDPNKQIKTTTVHQKIVSINPESDDISGLLIPPTFFHKSLKKGSDISNHPLQKERIPKLIKNLAGSLFHKVNKKKLKDNGTEGVLEEESASSTNEGVILKDDEVEDKKCSCEELSEPIKKKLSVVKFADDVNQEIYKTNAECPESNTHCPKQTSETCSEKITVEKFSFFKDSDSKSFIEFIKTVPLTGDRDVDEEIVNFYRTKFQCK
ncbi:kinesin heavy chain-like isoform X2 [Agrilus planipennis]|nr:kinesin heavy chain-like isoform X2 [Agrilus planipennis]XP_018324671.1 kinesin heavy chain-like isoform X2 [Agrilus planipennis]XP_018324672.1 kinesin heavy chain-like isoform X2 [Agrilus planipennis]